MVSNCWTYKNRYPVLRWGLCDLKEAIFPLPVTKYYVYSRQWFNSNLSTITPSKTSSAFFRIPISTLFFNCPFPRFWTVPFWNASRNYEILGVSICRERMKTLIAENKHGCFQCSGRRSLHEEFSHTWSISWGDKWYLSFVICTHARINWEECEEVL